MEGNLDSHANHSSVLGMSSLEIIDLCSDEESESVDVDVKPNFLYSRAQMKASCETAIVQPKLEECATAQVFEENRISNIVNGGSNSSYIVDQGSTSANGFCSMSASHGSSVPLSRQFWKSGDYEVRCVPEPSSRNGNALRVHPKFLHSNATSHKWALGAIAELLDNAVDEVQNGATFVIVDRFTCSDGGDPALLIHDDGGGMDPESLRRCMSFGFSDKQSSSSIGQYGNGFKTSTMRLGADVIVFSRCMNKRKLTQSVGLLSYTFLRQTGSDDIVVPVVDYEFDTSTGAFERLLRYGEKQFSSNLSILLKWSPFATEEELLKQFTDIGHHGTKIVVYNLWFNDDGNLELDFESDAEDIFISGSHKRVQTNNATKLLNQKHIANRLHYSFRAYLSILYLHIPDRFRIMLRGKVVELHNIVNDLNYLECIKYRPQVGGNTEAEVVTFIGFLQGAPNVNVHGFNVYHKNRLILPFWKVANNSYGKGRGVVGVLEANFIKPTHDKQDFEKSTLYQKLETRLKEMTYEYWDYHCHLIGYTHSKVVPRAAPLKQMSQPKACDGMQQVKMKCGTQAPSHRLACAGISTGLGPLKVDPDLPIADDSIAASLAETSQGTLRPSSLLSSREQAVTASHAPKHSVPRQLAKDNVDSQRGLLEKRWYENHVDGIPAWKRQAIRSNNKTQAGPGAGREQMQEIITMMQENKKLHSECLEYEEREKVLLLKEQKLKSQLQEVQQVYKNLLLELRSMDVVESEKL